MFTKIRKSRDAIRRAAISTIETLERRMLLAVDCLYTGAMSILGDSNGNNFTFTYNSGNGHVTANHNGNSINLQCTDKSVGGVTVFGGDGNDTVDGSALPSNIPIVVFGQNDDDSITGTPGPDTIKGGADDDWVYGANGDDYVYGDDPSDAGLTGTDTVLGGVGVDELFGGPGDDIVGAYDFNLEGR
jgi:Ca2+-binding RTX toxin-like protein